MWGAGRPLGPLGRRRGCLHLPALWQALIDLDGQGCHALLVDLNDVDEPRPAGCTAGPLQSRLAVVQEPDCLHWVARCGAVRWRCWGARPAARWCWRGCGTWPSPSSSSPARGTSQPPAVATPGTLRAYWPRSDSACHDQNGHHATMPESWGVKVPSVREKTMRPEIGAPNEAVAWPGAFPPGLVRVT